MSLIIDIAAVIDDYVSLNDKPCDDFKDDTV